VEPLHHRVTDVGESRPISFWADQPDVVDQGQVPADWFTQVLGFPCWLALAADAFDRMETSVLPLTPPEIQSRFTAGGPIQTIHQASFREVLSTTNSKLPITDLRPNVVLDNGEPWEECAWVAVRIGDVNLVMSGKVPRCTLAESVAESLEPAERRIEAAGRPIFGVYLENLNIGNIRVGDEVEVMKRL
jgi:uncharacterized protein YcbX